MANPESPIRSSLFRDALETTLRIGLVLVLLVWCFQIVRPFITPVLWGVILAIAVSPLYRRLVALLGGRRKSAAAILVVLALALFAAPALNISGALVDSLQDLADRFRAGELRIPPPPERVAEWPLIGERLSAFWSLAATNLEAALLRLSPQLQALGGWLLGAAAGIGIGLLQFVFSLVIAGVVLATSEVSRAGVEKLMRRLAGADGQRIVELAESTIRSVATGIVGVALIQATLAGIGFVAVGLPAAGLVALAVLFLCIIQIGPILILVPAVIYVFAHADTLTASLFLIWSLIIALIDNFLKPLLLGRGVDAPILVIFVGAIGGFLSMGIVGLFVGSVVLVLFHTLFVSWVNQDLSAETRAPAAAVPAPSRAD